MTEADFVLWWSARLLVEADGIAASAVVRRKVLRAMLRDAREAMPSMDADRLRELTEKLEAMHRRAQQAEAALQSKRLESVELRRAAEAMRRVQGELSDTRAEAARTRADRRKVYDENERLKETIGKLTLERVRRGTGFAARDLARVTRDPAGHDVGDEDRQ